MSDGHDRRKGIGFALMAACLFGASTPLAKVLLPRVEPVLMAGLLYLGSGIGLGVYSLLRSRNKALRAQEAPLRRKDWPWLAGAIFAGGALGPVLLLWGLRDSFRRKGVRQNVFEPRHGRSAAATR